MIMPWWICAPQAILVVACLLLLTTRMVKAHERVSVWISGVAFAATLVCVWTQPAPLDAMSFWDDMLVWDTFSYVSTALIAGFGILVTIAMGDYAKDFDIPITETLVLVQLQAIGMMSLCAASHWIAVFVSMELAVLPVYALVVLRRDDKQALEAGIKYILMGIAATALLMYGVSVVYAITGSLRFSGISDSIEQALDNQASVGLFLTHPRVALWLLLMGMSCILAALSFKFGLVPFHFWVADVYQGASAPVVLQLATVPKWAFLVLWARVFNGCFASMVHYWQGPVLALAVLSLVFGHMWAVSQTHIRRLLGFASIAQMGYVFLGLGLATPLGTSVAFGYLLGYVLASGIAFMLLSRMRGAEGEVTRVADLGDWMQKDARHAAYMLVALFSFIGIPPFLGFMLKLNVIAALVRESYYLLSAFTMLISVIGAVYYVGVIKTMLFARGNAEGGWVEMHGSVVSGAVLTALVAALALLGVYPDPILKLGLSLAL